MKELADRGLGHDENTHTHRGGEDNKSSPNAKNSSKRKSDQGANRPTSFLDHFDVGPERNGTGEQVEKSKCAYESGQAANNESTRPLTGLPDDQRSPNTRQRDRKSEAPYAEHKGAPRLHAIPDRPGATDEGQRDKNRENYENQTPDIVGLTTEGRSHRVTKRSQLLLKRALGRFFILLRLGHPSPPGSLPGGCPNCHVKPDNTRTSD
jgi:hypothetical protein